MTKNIIIAASLAISTLACGLPASQAVASPLDWFSGEKVQGNGNIKKQSRELAHFTGISMSLPAAVELRIGNTEGITIETDDNLLPLIETVIENGTLKVRASKRNMNLQPRTLKIVIHAKEVERVSLGGSGSIESDALKGGKMKFDLGGSGTINIKNIEGESISVTVGGSGTFKTGGGSATNLSVTIGGSGDVDLGRVKASEASVSVAGSGEAVIWASNSLSVTIAGSGDVNYYGDPKLSQSVVGSGGARRLAAKP
ncbi:MAG: head GIN domain-containing protein [Pseudomonadota bacterium]